MPLKKEIASGEKDTRNIVFASDKKTLRGTKKVLRCGARCAKPQFQTKCCPTAEQLNVLVYTMWDPYTGIYISCPYILVDC